MNDLIRAVIVGFLSGVAGAAFVVTLTGDESQEVTSSSAAPVEDSAELLERIAALEEQLANQSTTQSPSIPAAASPVQQTPTDAVALPREGGPPDWRARQQRRFETQLKEAGWSDSEIAEVEQSRRDAALQMEQQQYESMRRMLEENPDRLLGWQGGRDVLRESLGDDRYEEYLVATGSSTSVQVRDVLEGSAGASAGLQTGDQIRAYGSERVFNDTDLMIAIASAEPGSSVTVEVERDGATFHVTVPVGPLGTSGIGRAASRRF